MLEQLLIRQGATNFFPESGPGNKTLLKGNVDAGYFGVVTAAELFAPNELSQRVGLTAGTPLNGTGGWYKFVYKGKFIFIARIQDRNSVTWNDLYNAGLVYGTKDNGAYPIGDGVYQYHPQRKIEGERSWFLVPRLPRMAALDPARSTAPITDVLDTEWAQTFCRLMAGFGAVDKWDSLAPFSYAYASTYMGDWAINTQAENLTYAWSAGSGPDTSRTPTPRPKTGATGNQFWRPVLELISGDVLMDIWDLREQSYGTLPPSILTVYSGDPSGGESELIGVYSPKNVKTVWPTYSPSITPVFTSITGVMPPKNVESEWPTYSPSIVPGNSYTASAMSPKNLYGATDVGLNPINLQGVGTDLVQNPRNVYYQSQNNLNPFMVSGENIA